MRPWLVSLPLFLAASACPLSLRTRLAPSMSPFDSSRARFTSIIPAAVSSRSCLIFCMSLAKVPTSPRSLRSPHPPEHLPRARPPPDRRLPPVRRLRDRPPPIPRRLVARQSRAPRSAESVLPPPGLRVPRARLPRAPGPRVPRLRRPVLPRPGPPHRRGGPPPPPSSPPAPPLLFSPPP